MDFQSDNHFNEQYRPPVRPQDVMQSAAIVLGVVAIVTTCCIYSSIIFGSLSIVLALLSRGDQKNLTPQGKVAVILSSIAIGLSVIATVCMFVITIHQYGSIENFINAYMQVMESLTGMPLMEGTGI